MRRWRNVPPTWTDDPVADADNYYAWLEEQEEHKEDDHYDEWQREDEWERRQKD